MDSTETMKNGQNDMGEPIANLFVQKPSEFSFHADNVEFTLLMDFAFAEATPLKKESEKILHTHSYYEFFLVTEGSLDVFMEDHFVEIATDGLIIINPDVRHRTEKRTPDTSRYNLNFSFKCNSLETDYNLYSHLKLMLDGFAYVALRNAAQERATMDRFRSYVNMNKSFLLTACFYELMLSVLDKCGGIKTVPLIAPMLADSNIGRIYKLNRIINAYYMYNIPLEYIAERLFISVRQLDRIIRRHYGRTYTEQITFKRMQSAVLLLFNTKLSVAQIAREVGYQSVSGFYKAFYKFCGCAPLEYKKRFR